MKKEKKEIRNKMIKLRDAMSLEDKKIKDNKIFNKLINNDDFKKAINYFLFVSFRSEIETKTIINYLIDRNKNVFVPKVVGNIMKLYQIKSLEEDLEKGVMGIKEPKESLKELTDEKLDFILMPGLAFDNLGGRIGYGGGYYDKFLSSLDYLNAVPKIAIAYKFQVINHIPMNDYDIRVDNIITD